MRTLTTLVLLALCSGAFAQDSVMTFEGFGTVDSKAMPNQPQARRMAQRAAEIDAQKALAEYIRGVEITAGTTVEEFEVTSDLAATRVRGMIKGFFVVDQNVYEEDGYIVAEVTLGICVNNRSEECRQRVTLDSFKQEASQLMRE